MKLFLHELAQKEIRDAAVYYESKSLGLGQIFIDSLEITTAQIKYNPTAWPLVGFQIRAIQIERFGYKLFYRIDENIIFILAVAHCRKKPLYWIDRI